MRIILRNLYLKQCNQYSNYNLVFVPKHSEVSAEDVSLMQSFVCRYKNILVLTGAGISTESGLPDYRSEGVGLYDRSPNRPVQYRDFISKPQVRKRYWARNFIAWDKFSSSKPNITHFCLAEWERKGILNHIITQNVDRLHHKAGSEHVTELHGTSYIVKCLNCGHRFSRYLLQKKFLEINKKFSVTSEDIRPDADIDIDPSLTDTFKVVNCEKCDGILKPDVVFFGETVPKELVSDIYCKVKACDAMLVLGSSLEVYSGYRFVSAASEQGKPIGIVNIGPTRADSLATFKLRNRCGELLPKIQCSQYPGEIGHLAQITDDPATLYGK